MLYSNYILYINTMLRIIATSAVRFIYNPYETFNPSYNPIQDLTTILEEGSRTKFCTDYKINGEYFKTKTKNEYYRIIPSNKTINDIIENELNNYTTFKSASEILREMDNYGYDPEKHCIVKLVIEDNKGYFVENYQYITAPPKSHVEIMSDVTNKKTFIYRANMKFEPIPEDNTF